MKKAIFLSAVVAGLTACASHSFAKDVLITTDCGTEVDDQWAIAHLARSKRIHVIGVIAAFAPNQPGGSLATAECSSKVLSVISKIEIPVIRGSDVQMLDVESRPENAGVQFLLKLSKRYSSRQRLQVLGLGPVTDIAKALKLDPTLAGRIEVNALAFDRYPEGGDGWNVSNDIRAWQIVLDSPVPVTVTSGLIAQRDLSLKLSDIDRLFRAKSKAKVFLVDLFSNWLKANGQNFPETNNATEWPIWDEAVTAATLGMTDSSLMIRPTLNDDLSFGFPNKKSSAPFRWVKAVDRSALIRDLNSVLR